MCSPLRLRRIRCDPAFARPTPQRERLRLRAHMRVHDGNPPTPGPLTGIVREPGGEAVPEALCRRLAPRDLSSLLLHVFAARAEAVEPRDLLQRFAAQKAAQPGRNDPRALQAIAVEAFAAGAA